MTNDDNPFSEHLDAIEAVLAQVCRLNRLSADDGEEFCSWARLRLLENDCAILRKFRGLSSFKVFLTVVANRLLLDWRISEKKWGKWRPTPRALEMGPLAVDLEMLVLRDGHPYDEAVKILISRGHAQSEVECDELWRQLRRAAKRRFLALDDLDDEPSRDEIDPVENQRRRELQRRAVAAAKVAVAALPPAEQLLLKLRFASGLTVARIAKLKHTDQKKLYRRYEQILAGLKAAVRTIAGITEDDIRDLFGGWFDLDDDDDDDDGGGESGPVPGNVGIRPSNKPNAGGVAA